MFNHDKFLNLFAIFWIFLVPLELKSGHTVNLGALPCACRPGTRRIWEVCCVPAVRAHGEQPPTPSAGRDGVCPLFFAVSLYIHTVKRFAMCPTFGTRQTRSLPSPWLPSALCRRPPSAKSSPCAYVVSGCVHSFLAACEIYTTRMTVTFYWSIHVCVYVIVFLEIQHSWLYWWNWNLWNCNFCWWACSICPLNFLALFTTYKDVSMMFVGLDESAYIPVIGGTVKVSSPITHESGIGISQ